MTRSTGPRPGVIGITLLIALETGCITVRPVMVDRKTALENDILGSFEQLNRDLPLLESTRATTSMEPTRRSVLQALLDQQLEAPMIAQLKSQQAVGEARDGLLDLRIESVEATARATVERENRRRHLIYTGLITLTAGLKEADLPAVRQFFHARYVAECQSGDLVQDARGAWKPCTARN